MADEDVSTVETPQAFIKPTPRARMVMCNICGMTGYPNQVWQAVCTADERFPCGLCPLVFHTKKQLATHGRHHGPR